MKRAIPVLLAVLLTINVMRMMSPHPASAQAANGNIVLLQVGPVTSCVWPANVTAGMVLCATTSGLYYTTSPTGTFIPVGAAGGVSSFNGRTGAVTLSKADVMATQIAATTTLQ